MGLTLTLFRMGAIPTNAIPSASPKLLNLNQDHPSKKWFFWSNPHKIEISITSVLEMLDYQTLVT